jgi:asparagine synthase (glutamine-hydrolysing)
MHAEVVSRHLDTDHTCVIAKPSDALSIVPQLSGIYCEPFADSSQIPTIMVSRIAAAHVKVALSGDGADELFGGYNSYQFLPRLAALSRLPGPLRRGIAETLDALPRSLAGMNEARLRRLRRVLLANGKAELMDGLQVHWDFAEGAVLAEDGAPRRPKPYEPAFLDDLVSSMMLADAQHYLPEDVLVKVDRASMSTSLETRAPFLNRGVFDAAWSLPLPLKVRPGQGKFVLRKLLARYVPGEIVDRPKKGFSVPIAQWLRGPLREWAAWLLDPGRIAAQGILDGRPVRKLWEEHLSGSRDHADRLWPVLMFQGWLEENSAR